MRTLLRRWGVIFWKLLAREAAWLPPWRDILMLLPQLGGARRDSRRALRRRISRASNTPRPKRLVCCATCAANRLRSNIVSLSAADPLNLLGIITPGPRLASLAGNRLLYRDGTPLAILAAGEIQYLQDLKPQGTVGGAHRAAAPPRARRPGRVGGAGELTAFYFTASMDASQPPPSASISATLPCRRLDSTDSAVSSALKRVVCAVITLL